MWSGRGTLSQGASTMPWQALGKTLLAGFAFATLAIGPAWSQRITTLGYNSVPASFEWIFEWNRTLPAAPELWSAFGGPGVGPPAGDPWEPALVIGNFGGAGLFGDFAFTAQNVTGPDVGIDVDPGNPYAFTLLNAFALGATGGAQVAVPGAAAVTTHTPHDDVYSLTYAQMGVAGLPVFIFTGRHGDFVVPEPTALSLLAVGGFGLAAARWRRRFRASTRAASVAATRSC